MILRTHDIERTMLSSLLQCDMTPDPTIADFRVEPSLFVHPLHKLVAKAIKKLQEKGYPPYDAYVQEVIKAESLDKNMQNAYIEILAANPIATRENLERYYKILKKRRSQEILKAIR